MEQDTDSAYENDEEEEIMRRRTTLAEMSLEYITALENSLRIEKKRAESYQKIASNTLNVLNKLMVEYRAAYDEDLERDLDNNTEDCLGPHRNEMVMAAGNQRDEMRVVANAITFYALEICAHDTQLKPVDQFYRIKKIFENLGLRCT